MRIKAVFGTPSTLVRCYPSAGVLEFFTAGTHVILWHSSLAGISMFIIIFVC
jgi:hypothetical protein